MALILLPIIVVVIMSFTASTTLEFPPPALSFRWYADVWDMATGENASFTRLLESFWVSLIIAGLSALGCVAAGVPASYALVRYKFAGRAAIEELLGLPIVFPAVVLGIALLILVSASGIDFGIWQIVIAHCIIFLPFMMRNCMTALKSVDPALEEAAKTLGASPLRTFFEIVLPLIRSGVASGVLLVFVLSFNEFTLSYFLYTVDVFPLSIWLFQQSNTSFSPAIFAISALTIFFNAAIILIVDALVGRGGGALR
ncbi:ABC transporter permease [Pseudohoeflea coraliihabitans]|nr:ABC transporter permease [Pseudohoeflea sp. DP4N28-3]